ncbi:hypothetical protein DMX11_02980 [Pseudomonas sp. LB-090624]|uniref:hypothetical protein n=1 Tax=Pseudomonas TaxID=286 RepID=UPI000D987A02|nr:MULTISPECIES: hypothetical protein [unclassified Pseudomonas]MCX2890137.1 hypothetical protein [Pseudomonas sp. DCB_BI]MDH4552118.1 hypothetical protein [Pseudomonas sp. BN607]PYB81034.1 hypothetical protein DMX11_02980 [Pseudomonas sp. LB-090624]
MKSTKCIPLLVIASVLSLAAHADPAGNCAAKIKELEDIKKTDGQALHGGMAHDYHELLMQAKEAQASGDMSKCQASADRAKTIYNKARGK